MTLSICDFTDKSMYLSPICTVRPPRMDRVLLW